LVELSEGQKKLKKVFLQIAKNLNSRGRTIEVFFSELHGATELKTVEVTEKDLFYLCQKYYNDKTLVDPVNEADVKLIFSQLQKD